MRKDTAPDEPRPVFIGAWALILFLIWSNSFIAIGLLLGSEEQAARFDPLSLTVARFVPLLLIVVPIILIVWPREALRVVRQHWRRLLVCGFLAVPGYSLALYAGQAGGVPPPIASIETSLAPLFLMILSAAFLGERLSRQSFQHFAGGTDRETSIALFKGSHRGRPQFNRGLRIGGSNQQENQATRKEQLSKSRHEVDSPMFRWNGHGTGVAHNKTIHDRA